MPSRPSRRSLPRAASIACAALAVALLTPRPMLAQVVNPAEAQKPPSQGPATGDELELPDRRLRTWEMPPTVVTARRGSALREEDRIGPYGQPRWTAHRRFPSTRIYVRPPGEIEFEHWTRVKTPRNGPTTVETQYELEVGLPHRFQLDLYAVTDKTGGAGELNFSEQKFEIRYALADWGEIPANPTAYFEWVERDEEADKLELKLLLGDELTEGWHWGSNLVFEHEVSGALENELGLTMGVSRTIVDERFSVGAELKAAWIDEHGSRGDFTRELEIGPTIQYRPFRGMHVDFAPLVGIGSESRQSDVYLVLGWEL